MAAFGVWLGIAIHMLWVAILFLIVAALGALLEVPAKRGSKLLSVQFGAIATGFAALTVAGAIFGLSLILGESQQSHRPTMASAQLIYDGMRELLGPIGGVLFWTLCVAATAYAAVLYVRRALKRTKGDAT